MRKFLTSLTSFISVMAASMLLTTQVMAQQDACGVERQVTPKPLDEQTWKRLNDIYEDIGEENYDLAFEKLNAMSERSRGSDYLKAIIQQLLGQVQWARENYNHALTAFEEAVRYNALPNQTHYSLMFQIAQLYYMNERFSDALRSLDLWFCKAPVEQIKASAHILKASIYAEMQDWANVIPSVSTAISMEEEPKENWYQLKLAAHQQLSDLPSARDTLKIMVQKWGSKKIYWVQLSNVHFQLEDDHEALSTMVLAYRQGLLDKQTDYLYISNMYSLKEVPYKAAEILEEGIQDGFVEPSEKHWKMAADAWFHSEELEKALLAYEKAGALSLDGELDLRRGYILVDLERWEAAKEALEQSVEKGGIRERDEGEALLMIGMCEFSLDEWDKAEEVWLRATRIESSRSSAQQWLAHLREERRRLAAL